MVKRVEIGHHQHQVAGFLHWKEPGSEKTMPMMMLVMVMMVGTVIVVMLVVVIVDMAITFTWAH